MVGENFGLAGSNPTVRIGGKPCAQTFFKPQVVRIDSSSVEDPITPNTYNLGGTDDALLNSHNIAGNALVNAFSSATNSMKQQYPEHCWNGMLDDGSDRGFNYGTPTVPKYIDQGELGIDTGGPCFPLHCSSCPVPTRHSGPKIFPLVSTSPLATASTSVGVNWNNGAGTYFLHSGTVRATNGASTSVTLEDDASALTDDYVGLVIRFACGTGLFEQRVVTAYTNRQAAVPNPKPQSQTPTPNPNPKNPQAAYLCGRHRGHSGLLDVHLLGLQRHCSSHHRIPVHRRCHWSHHRDA